MTEFLLVFFGYALGLFASQVVRPWVRAGQPRREQILCAAIWVRTGLHHAHQPTSTGLVFCGHRHSNIIQQLVHLDDWSKVRLEGRYVQGFLTLKGRFVTRDEAAVIARAAYQVSQSHKHQLYSEDLY